MAFDLWLLVSILIIHAAAAAAAAESHNKTRFDIVYMGAASTTKVEHAQLLTDLIEREANPIVHTYNKSFSGFVVRLSEDEADAIAGRPGVVSVFPDSMSQLHTTRSLDFLKNQSVSKNNIYPTPTRVSNGSSGRDTIIGIIDTGIWPQHPSFNYTYTSPVPQRWKGICMRGENFIPFECNMKVIGARYYDLPHEPGSITTAMDMDGHGTHVASTAAGMPVDGASYYGFAKGVARGVSPNSRIAAYCACTYGCPDSSVLKAFDDAIADGVDVISASFSGISKSLFTNAIAIGAFHAVEKGVIVVASAGNRGPSSGTVQNFSPWILTVGATTMDRDFQMGIVLGGRNELIKGGGIAFLNRSADYPLVDGRSVGYNQLDSTNATNCVLGSLDDAKVKGKIVLCNNNIDRTSMFDKIDAMIEQGVIWIILIDNEFRQSTYSLGRNIPVVSVSEADGAQIHSYINSTRNPSARILPTVEVSMDYKPAPVVAVLSARGPASGIKNLIKPDVTAPGVNILAAWCFNDTSEVYPNEPPLFEFQSGTSMSVPHVSGLVANLRSWHPTWTPSAIKSAIMTTAIHTDNTNAPITTFTGSVATPYDIGSGEISLFSPLWLGLVYETETIDYMIFLCNMGYNASMINVLSLTVPDNFVCPSNSNPDFISDLNYPSIAVSGLMPNVRKSVKRTAINVGQVYSAYKATVESPAGVHVQVVPNKLRFTKNVKKLSFQVIFMILNASFSSSEEDLFGSITWSNNFHKVRSPFVVSNA